jgi:hypothetical protein
MPDNANPAQPPAKAPSPQSAADAGHVPMTEEMDSAKWTLPPIVPILIAVVAVGIAIAVVAYSNRPTPTATGSITKVLSSDQQSNVLVAVHLNFRNEQEKQLWIREIKSEVETSDGKKYTDSSAPAVDLDRYLRGAPELAEGQITPLKAEMKIPAHATQAGMVIFAYPVTKAMFDSRKSFTVRVDFYDHAPMVLKQ